MSRPSCQSTGEIASKAPVYHAPPSLAFQEETTPGHATVIAANAITELTSDTATAEEAEERELQGPVWWALAPPAISVSGYPILANQ